MLSVQKAGLLQAYLGSLPANLAGRLAKAVEVDRLTDGALLPHELILDGLAFIEQSKMDPANLRVGENVVVIGAGNTAIDCATVAKRSGASRVTMVYRRTERDMSAYPHEYEFVKKEGVEFEFQARPVSAHAEGLECIRGNSTFLIPADTIVKAIGQQKPSIASLLGLETDRGFIKVSPSMETSVRGIYAGGDCIRAKGSASTVMAAQDGKIAATAIQALLSRDREGAV